MKNLKLKALAVVMPLMLTACTTTPDECDPTGDPSMLAKLGCVVSGSYQKRVEVKQQEIKSLREEQQKSLNSVLELEKNRSQMIADRAYRLKQLDKIQSQIDDLRVSLKQKGALNKTLETKLANLQKAKDDYANMSANASTMENRQKERELETQRKNLNETIAAMVGSNNQTSDDETLDSIFN